MQATLDSNSFFRRAIFTAALIGIFILHTVFSFHGLTSKTGIDQAQIAREVARGNGFTSQFIRPISIQQLIDNDRDVNIQHMPDTYHSPLNILVYAGALKMVGGDHFDSFKLAPNDKVYQLDRVIAFTCATFFLIAIGINYLLISRIFDQKIASVVALIMMLSEYMWQITQAGLPQMLMLALFSAASYLAWRAVEAQEAEQKPLVPALLSGFFFGLLVLAHWMTLWIFLGYFLFAVFYFRPRGIIAISLAAIISLFIAGPLIFYWSQTGEIFGTAFHAIHGAGTPSDMAMRQMETSGFNINGFLFRTAQTTLTQAANIHNYLGGLVLAPAFFLCLAYPFKRTSIAIFRWNILLMWVCASIGMAIYGLTEDMLDPNQMHILFAPLMSAFGIALISIIWSRHPLSQKNGFLGNLHFVVILLVTAAPLMLQLKQLDKLVNSSASVNGIHPFSLNSTLHDCTEENAIIVSDQPWAVAWYGDRHAIWMPTSLDDLNKIENIVTQKNPQISGVHFSSVSYKDQTIRDTYFTNKDLTPIIYSVWFEAFSQTPHNKLFGNTPLAHHFFDIYPHPVLLVGLTEPSVYYSRTPISSEQ